jgi:SNF2 family DNA or RNA helicase
MSMSAGGEGLNLTAASTCFICEPWWNGAKEDQCVGRINRIGQQARQVRVRKFVVANSVEERIIELQKRKAYMADEIYSEDARNETSATGGSRLTVEEFRLLFKT